MTDRVEALRALLSKVEAGEWDHSPNGAARAVFPYRSASIDDMGLTAPEAFNGSLDAALALHNAVLPGWTWSTADDAHGERWFVVGDGAHFETDEVYNEVPARAWLCAILEALIAEQEGEGA